MIGLKLITGLVPGMVIVMGGLAVLEEGVLVARTLLEYDLPWGFFVWCSISLMICCLLMLELGIVVGLVDDALPTRGIPEENPFC